MANQANQSSSDFVSPSEASRLVGMSPRTLARMADQNRITVAHPTGTRHRRYVRAEILALVAADENAAEQSA
jgi:hypothetical protein